MAADGDRRVRARPGPALQRRWRSAEKDGADAYETVSPQTRVVIGECAGHAIVAADVPGRRDGKQTLACSLHERPGADIPLLADRGLCGFRARGQARRLGAQPVWRVRAALRPYRLRDLDDGSRLAVITHPAAGLHRSQRGRLCEDTRRPPMPAPTHRLTYRALAALICAAATTTGASPDRATFPATLPPRTTRSPAERPSPP